MDQQGDGVRTVFDRALAIESPAERSAYLDEVCAGKPELRQEVESLLRAHRQAGNFLNQPADRPVPAVSALTSGATLAVGHSAKQDPASTESQAGAEMPEEGTNLDFLQPSAKPGSLGRLSHYEILEVLGKGGFGIVFKAFDEKLQRVVAVKVMAPHLAATSPPRKRFLREARAAAAIRHENVVAVHAVEDQPIPYLVMEYIAGQTLQARLNAVGPLELLDVLRIGRQIAEGLTAAHGMGIIHRDIKPSNILLENGVDHVKITDFGLARAADDASLTQSGMIAGTPMYMAPEQACGAVIDQRADLFSLGSVLYVMSTGRPPFRATSTMAVLKRVAEDTPRPMREIIPEIPEWLCQVVARLHAKKPGERYVSAKEVAGLLASYQSELQLRGSVRSPPLPSAVTMETTVSRLGPETPVRRIGTKTWKGRAFWAALIGTGLLAGAVGLWASGLFRPAASTDAKQAVVVPADPAATPKTEWTVGLKGARFISLYDAVQAAPSGATIEVQPGTYRENPLVLDKNVEIVGRGPRGEITIICETGTTILSRADKVRLRGLTIRSMKGSAVKVSRGECRLKDCDLSQAPSRDDHPPPRDALLLVKADPPAVAEEGDKINDPFFGVLFTKGERPTVELVDCKLHDALGGHGVYAERCQLTAERCTIERTASQGMSVCNDADVKLRFCEVSATTRNNLQVHLHVRLDARDCRFLGALPGYINAIFTGETTARLSRCRIVDGSWGGVWVTTGSSVSLEDCDVTGNRTGVVMQSFVEDCRRCGWQTLTTATLTNTRVTNNRKVGLYMREDAKAIVTGCDFRGNAGGAWDVAPSCTIQRENNQEDRPADGNGK